MPWQSECDYQEAVTTVLRNAGGSAPISKIARQISELWQKESAENRVWLQAFLADEITFLPFVLESYPFTFLGSTRSLVALRPVRARAFSRAAWGWVHSTHPYLAARALCLGFTEWAVHPPFPGIEMVAREFRVEPERIEESLRIMTLLPPSILWEAQVPWALIRSRSFDQWAEGCLAGALPHRLTRLAAVA